MKIKKWIFGLSARENMLINLSIERQSYTKTGRKINKLLQSQKEFDFAPYIKNEYNNNFPLGIGQKAGCAVYNIFDSL